MRLPHTFRPAIAMIELIFAIVVMGITLLSVPMVMNQSIASSTVAMQQEAVVAAGSQLGLILTQKWDAFDSNDTGRSGIINVAGGAAALNDGSRDLNDSYSKRSFNDITILPGYTDATPIAMIGQENVFYDDVDDFNGQSKTLTLYGAESESLTNNKGEYLDTTLIMTNTVTYGVDNIPNYTADPVVFNAPFTSAATSTNIKLISVRLTSDAGIDEHNKSIFLSAFVCNVGTASPNRIPMK